MKLWEILGIFCLAMWAAHSLKQSGVNERIVQEHEAQVQQLAKDAKAVDALNKKSSQAQVVYRDRIKIVEKLVPVGSCIIPEPIVEQLRDASKPLP